MSDHPLCFALFGDVNQPEKAAIVKKISAVLDRHGARWHVVPGSTPAPAAPDFAISLGGDGTLLKAVNQVGERGTPVIGVNMGRLGFLADFAPDDIETTLESVFCGDYSVDERTVIRLETDGEPLAGSPDALNDIAVLKRDSASMISIHCRIDGEQVVTYQADGLVVSTPTGSTAYSLSNGGPIIVPQTGVLCLTPVAPHSLNLRPLVTGDDCRIELRVESRSHNFLVAVDGRSEKLREGTRLTIVKAPYKARIVKRSNAAYFSTLREKMMWGMDGR